MSLFNFRIPTILGLAIIFFGLVVGVYLVLQNQPTIITTQAAPDKAPQNITFSNIEDDQAAVSWQTETPIASFVKLTGPSGDQTFLDDKDITPSPHILHHVTLNNLNPETSYQIKIVTGKLTSETLKFTTAVTADSQNGYKPIIGSVIDQDKPLSAGLVYLKLNGAIVQSAPIKSLGNFIIPISKIRSSDLSQIFVPNDDLTANLTILAENGNKSSVTFTLKDASSPLVIKLGQDIDLTKNNTLGVATSKFDLNGDGFVNTSDYSIVLHNFGKDPKDKRADFNQDGVVDKKDLKIISDEINKNSGPLGKAVSQ